RALRRSSRIRRPPGTLASRSPTSGSAWSPDASAGLTCSQAVPLRYRPLFLIKWARSARPATLGADLACPEGPVERCPGVQRRGNCDLVLVSGFGIVIGSRLRGAWFVPLRPGQLAAARDPLPVRELAPSPARPDTWSARAAGQPGLDP